MAEKKKYGNLYQMIEQDQKASCYYNQLPKYVQEQIDQRADNVCSIDALQTYADNILQGDD